MSRRERPLSAAQGALLRRCLDEGGLDVQRGGNPWRTARALVRRGYLSAAERGVSDVRFEISDAGRDAALEIEPRPESRAPKRPTQVMHSRRVDTSETAYRTARRSAAIAVRAEVMRERQRVDDWNGQHPIGTLVDYRPVPGEPATRRVRTRGEARLLGGEEPVVPLEGLVGCVSLRHVTPVGDQKSV